MDLTTITQVTELVDDSGRKWRAEPDGPNDRPVDIYYNGTWVPAYFSDLQKGDFFLDVKMMRIEDNQCFMATSKLIRSVSPHSQKASFIIQGLEVVQAPALKIKDINALPAAEQLRLEIK